MVTMDLFTRLAVFCLLWSNALCDITSDWGTLNICVTRNPSGKDNLQKQCNGLEKNTNQKIKCVFAVDRLRCLELLMAGKADFGVFKAEDLLISATQNKKDINELVVINEFRFLRDQPYEFEMVVVVSNDVEINSLADLQGKRLCHPGFDENGWMNNDWSEMFSQIFEDSVVHEECNPNLSIFENRIKSLSEFFGPSCKPGPWSPDPAIDFKLKLKYRDLCKRCNSPSVCSQKDLYWGRTGPALCLTDCHGDVAWLRLADFRSSFKAQEGLYCHNVSFLCPDGTKQAIDDPNPCAWISHPWPSIVSRKVTAADVGKLISWVNDSDQIYNVKTWQYLLRVLFNMTFQPLKVISPIEVLEYLQQIPGFYQSVKIPKCKGSGDDRTITICVPNNATFHKCAVLANVAQVYSIDPGFQCIVSNDCLNSVSSGAADVTIISVENLKQAYEKQSLKTILYQTHYDYGNLRHAAAVVKSSSKMQSLQDLKGKRACFTEENGFGWNSVLMTLKEKSLIEDDCNGEASIRNFFSNVCIIYSKPEDAFPTCFPDDEVKPSGGSEVLESLGVRCIAEGGGDVAFIDYNNLGKYLQNNTDLGATTDQFMPICPYENVSAYECYLSWGSFGQVISRKNLSKEREEEIISAFTLLNSIFGDDDPSTRSSPVFRLFSHDPNEKNMLFQSAATRLERSEKFTKRGAFRWNNSYEIKLKNTVSRCLSKNVVNKSVISFPVIEIYVFQFVFMFYFSKNFIRL
ncbi:transferrin-like isoform X2 [Planococcus citri]|uniref:transferrin-like isoform X2 n=1 Tax=Planococcus citri TaxID=170843 RepID=UPI0031FA2DF3